MKYKLISLCLAILSLWLPAQLASATVFYVNVGNVSPAPPFTSWPTAATNIQDAVDAASVGDSVLVTNGVYAFGGRVMAGDLINRVCVSNAITVQSINGPWVTTILGAGATNGAAAVRCAWLTNGASLVGFTLTGGATRTSGDTVGLESGGGAWCASSNALVGNCVIVSNTATVYGGGIYQGSVDNSLVSSNGCGNSSGGAVYKAILNNCTVASNATYGAVAPLAMTNCILYYNQGGNYSVSGTAFSHCCTTPALSGTANLTAAPQFFADGVHLATNSPCLGAGALTATGTDIFGNAWASPPAIGCAEWTPAPVVSRPRISLTSDPVGFSVGGLFVESSTNCGFAWLKDGVPLLDDGHYAFTQTTNLSAVGVSWADAGNYQVVVSNAFGVVTSSVASLVVHCVAAGGVNPVAPYLTWAMAATNIQDAITAAAAGEVVLVTNGLYAAGGKAMDGVITNRVSVDKAMLVQSVNGAAATVIQGAWDATSTNGPGAVRCAWLTNYAILSGFTLYGGATRLTSSLGNPLYGGGVWGSAISGSGAASAVATVANCVMLDNAAAGSGGGAYRVILHDCTLATNSAASSSGGAGGGAASCVLRNCCLVNNYARLNGGGADGCLLQNCALTRNSAYQSGGAANGGSLVNCTVTSNTASGYSSAYGAAVYGANLTNCIVLGNFSLTAYPNTNYGSCTLA